MFRKLRSATGLGLLMSLLAACSGSGSFTVPPSQQTPAPAMAFTDTFDSSSFPSGPTYKNISGAMDIDPAVGNPAPGISNCGTTATGPGFYSYRVSLAQLVPWTGRTFSASMDVQILPGSSATGGFLVTPTDGGFPIALAAIDNVDMGVYDLGRSNLISASSQFADSTANDGKYHTITFSIAGNGAATWSRDGVRLGPSVFAYTVPSNLTPLEVIIHCVGNNEQVNFDNLTVIVK